MTRDLLLSALFVSTAAFGQLAPNTNAPLLDHMREVNAEWHSFSAPLDNAPAAFTNDTERIAQHLHLVREHLAMHAPEGLSAAQATERAALLDALEAYADAGRFPQNHVLPYRNPIFIDPHGTACAVGQLMIESGHRDLAERIDAAMETGYLAEIIADERFTAPVSAWATEHGFTADELAWIQPGYSPPILWYTLGEGTNGTVDEVLALSNGDLLVAGQFTDAGGTTCNGAARWNGSSYTAMGTLPEGVINCAIEFNGEIYIGGSFNNGQTDLLHWSDAGWDGEAVFASKWAEVTALHSHEGMLYAAGSGSGFAGTDYGVKVLQEGGWLPLPGVLNGPIHALEHHENYLIAGGAFTGEFLSLENDIMHVARYMDSGWRQVADGLDGTVYDLLILDGALYATGDMVSMMGTSFGLASIIGDVDTWMRLMPNIQHYIAPSPVDAPSVARAMVVKDGRIFIAGDINAFQGLTYGTGLVVYNGTPDSVEPYCNFMGPANSIALSGSQLVLAGASDAFANIIVTELGTGVNDTPRPLVLAFAPNPVKHQLTVTLPVGMSAPTSIRVTDAAGRIIDVDAQPTSTGMVIDVLGLATGSYAIELSDGIRTATGRFVKE